MPSKNGIFSLPQTKIFPGRNIYDRIYMIEKARPSLFSRKGDAERMYELDHPYHLQFTLFKQLYKVANMLFKLSNLFFKFVFLRRINVSFC